MTPGASASPAAGAAATTGAAADAGTTNAAASLAEAGCPPAPTRWTEVAVGIMIRPDGAVLLAQRPPGKPYAGWWEFPGGKVEPGESVAAALARELHEELGIDVVEQAPWLVRRHVYPHAAVRLHFRKVTGWRGAPHGREGQRFAWCAPDAIDVAPLLPAAVRLPGWLRLPAHYGISQAERLGDDPFLARLDAALAGGLRLVQLREPALAPERFAALFERVRARVAAHGARLLVSSAHPESFWRACDGVHLRAADCARLAARPAVRLVGASCHDAAQLAQAAALGADLAVLGPVAATASHPGAAGMGWPAFAALAALAELPVYALGGLDASDLEAARRCGAQGVAMLRAAWAPPHGHLAPAAGDAGSKPPMQSRAGPPAPTASGAGSPRA